MLDFLDSFRILQNAPIDTRFVVDDVTGLNEFVTNGVVYDGLTVWVKSLNEYKCYNSQLTTSNKWESIRNDLDESISLIDDRVTDLETHTVMGNKTYYQSTVPSSAIYGDLWFCTSNINTYKKDKLYRFSESGWIEITDANITELYSYVGGISSIVSTHTTQISTIDDTLTTITTDMSEIRQTANSVEAEISNARNEYSTLKQRIDAIDVTVAGGNKTYRQSAQPIGDIKVGDLWFDTTDNKLYRYDGTTGWVKLEDGDIGSLQTAITTLELSLDGIQGTVSSHTEHLSTIDGSITSISTSLSTVKQTADSVSTQVSNACDQGSTLKQTLDSIRAVVRGGNSTYRQTTQPTTDIIAGDIWFNTTNNKLYRYNGTQWEKFEDGDIVDVKTETANLSLEVGSIQGTVSSHTEHLSTIDGSITSINTTLSTVRQTAEDVSIEVGNACDQGSTLKQTLDAIRATVAGGNKTFRQATAPTTDILSGDIWYNTTDEHWYRYNGTSWDMVQDGDVATAITQSTEAIQTAQGFETRVSQVEQDVNTVDGRLSTAESSITQLATAITSKVEKDGIISSINQTPEEIKITSNKIKLSGYVSIVGDDNSESAISGDNITTNYLSVDGRINSDSIKSNHVYADDVNIASIINFYGANITPSTVSALTTITYYPATQNVIPVGDDHLRISLTRHTGTEIIPTTDNYTATVVIKCNGYAGQTTATVPISMIQGTTGGGGSVIIPFTTPSAAYIDSVTYSKDSLTYHPLNYINIDKSIKVTSIKSPLNVQEIQSENPFAHSTITYTDVMPQIKSNPGYPSSQIGSSTQKWDNIWGATIHANTIDIASFTPTYIGTTSNFVNTIYANRIIPNNTLNIGTSNGDGTINVGQIQINGYMTIKDNNGNIITMNEDGWRRTVGSSTQTVTWDQFFNMI